MARVLAMLFISMVVSGYYFPFSFAVLPQLNTKMALAMTGVFLVVLQGCRRHKISFSKELLGAIIFAFVFPLSVLLLPTIIIQTIIPM